MLDVTKPESKNTDKTVYEGAPIYPYGGLNIRSLWWIALIKLNKLLNYQEYSNRMTIDDIT